MFNWFLGGQPAREVWCISEIATWRRPLSNGTNAISVSGSLLHIACLPAVNVILGKSRKSNSTPTLSLGEVISTRLPACRLFLLAPLNKLLSGIKKTTAFPPSSTLPLKSPRGGIKLHPGKHYLFWMYLVINIWEVKFLNQHLTSKRKLKLQLRSLIERIEFTHNEKFSFFFPFFLLLAFEFFYLFFFFAW